MSPDMDAAIRHDGRKQVLGSRVPGFTASRLMDYVRMPAALGEIGSCLWLLVFGARAGRIGVSPPANP